LPLFDRTTLLRLYQNCQKLIQKTGAEPIPSAFVGQSHKLERQKDTVARHEERGASDARIRLLAASKGLAGPS
jgi:hypothetical protein